jgi:hypothetical protein
VEGPLNPLKTIKARGPSSKKILGARFSLPLFFVASSSGAQLSFDFFLSNSELSEKDFYETLSHGKAHFQTLAASQGEVLEVYADYDTEFDNAYSRREGSQVSITVYGGLKNRPLMNSDVLSLVFCHELGHLYGGEPYSNADLKKSLEGQADYWALFSGCADDLLARTPPPIPTSEDSVDWIDQNCRENDPTRTPLQCRRLMIAIERLSKAFHRGPRESSPHFWTPDPSRVNETLRTHPAVQCRMDTLFRASRRLSRPLCWFKNEPAVERTDFL